MKELLEFLNGRVLGILLPAFLLLGGCFLFFRLRAFFILHPRRTLVVLGRKEGESALRSLFMALAGTLGVGNISGVALAVALAGAGAVFWMWVSAVCAMLLKYAEVTLAVRYRRRTPKGEHYGGAAYYIGEGVGGRLGRTLAVIFALLCLGAAGTLGSLLQGNAVAECMEGVFSVPPLVSGLLLAAMTALVVLGGARTISRVTTVLIPVFSLLYLVLSLWAVFANLSVLPSVLSRIFSSAFSFASLGAGAIGFFTSRAVRFGVARGLLSNEAGCGTAPMAHATALNTPARQGLFGMLEVAIDTLVLCTATAFTVLIAYPETPSAVGGGVLIALYAYRTLLGRFAPYLVAASLVFFAYGTVVCWAYYGERSLAYLTESSKARRIYFLVFCLFLVLGSLFSSEVVFGLTDLIISLMTLINGTVLCLLTREIKEETVRDGLLPPVKIKKPRQSRARIIGARGAGRGSAEEGRAYPRREAP